MSEAEAGSLVVEYLALVHTYGEAVWGRIDLWVGASFGMILLGYFAPERLRPGVTVLIVGLYLFFSVALYSNAIDDNDKASALLLDAFDLAKTHGLELNILTKYNERPSYEFYTMVLFLFGLFVGTVGFLISACVTNLRNRTSHATSDA